MDSMQSDTAMLHQVSKSEVVPAGLTSVAPVHGSSIGHKELNVGPPQEASQALKPGGVDEMVQRDHRLHAMTALHCNPRQKEL